MKIAAAQTTPVKGDIEANKAAHLRLCKKAVKRGAKLILFPELSLTGYEPELFRKLALEPTDERLDDFRKLAVDNDLLILIGAPIAGPNEAYIGMLIFQPDGQTKTYTKYYLHTGEEKWATAKLTEWSYQLGGKNLQLAICAEITNPAHAAKAAAEKCDLYLASVFISPKGLKPDGNYLKGYAKQYGMQVLMANFGGESYGYASGGYSAFWEITGKVVAELDHTDEGLLVVDANACRR